MNPAFCPAISGVIHRRGNGKNLTPRLPHPLEALFRRFAISAKFHLSET